MTKKKVIKKTQESIPSPWIKYVVGAMLVLVICIGTYYVLKPSGEVEILDFAAKKTETITLKDKTKVTLREGSQLRHPSRFEGTIREVGFYGEAFFEIAKGSKPFVINVEHGKIEVTSTAFNLRTHRGNLLSIKVKEGEVRFTSKAGDVKEMAAGEALIFYYKNNQLFVVPMTARNMDSWITNTLVFNGIPFQNVVIDLNEHFDANIQIEVDAVKNCLYTSTFQDMTLDDILETIRNQFQLDGIDRFDTIIALRGGTCQR